MRVVSHVYHGKEMQEIRIRSLTFSDSILFITQDNSFEDFYLLSLTLSVFQGVSLERCIPTKGAISMGKLTADFDLSLFFGQALIDAYLLQDQLHYYGILADPYVDSFISDNIESNSPNQNPVSHFYQKLITPLKNNEFVTRYDLIPQILHATKIKYLYISVSENVRKYADNTIEILKAMKLL